jgi:glycosyltransferase involved in cell wall biosynthesis
MDGELAYVWHHHELFQRGGLAAATSRKCPLVVFVDAPIVWEGAQWNVKRPGWGAALERFGERPQLAVADVVACVTEEVAEQVVRIGAERDRVVITPCGVDVDRFHPEVSGETVRSRHGLTDRFVIGWAGTFHRFHGLDLLLDAFGAASRRHPDLALLLVGDGLDRPRVEARARDLGLDGVVFTGTVTHGEIPAHIAAMDAAMVVDPGTASFHYSPLKLREYLACGRPVIAPRSGQISRTVRDGEHLLLVPPGDVNGLVDALDLLQASPDLRARLGANGAQLVRALWTWERQAEVVDEALGRVAPRQRDRR